VSNNLFRLNSQIEAAGSGILGTRRAHMWRSKSAELLRDYFLEMCTELGIKALVELGASAAETSVSFVERTGGVGGHEILPGDGHETARWRT